ncbi:MAG: double zinc ribbon domain-containing protein [Methanobacterium sp.]
MVSSKEISDMLAARREGKLPKQEKIQQQIITGKKCPECGIQNKENAKFCVGCGKSLEEKEVKINPLDIKEKRNMKVCHSCKSEIPQNAKFCVVCGETQPSEGTKEHVAPEIEKPEIKSVVEDKKVDPISLDNISPKLVVQELILDEEGLKLNNNIAIEGLNENELIDYKDIGNIELKEEIIEITTNNSNIKIKGVNPQLADEFISSIQENINATEPLIDPEMVDKIQKAKELLDIGAIDEEEFEKIKRKILEDI